VTTPSSEGGVTTVPPGSLQAAGANLNQQGAIETLTVTLRHKTPNAVYRRAWVVLTKVAKQYEVTAEQFEILIDDTWIEVVENDAVEDAEK